MIQKKKSRRSSHGHTGGTLISSRGGRRRAKHATSRRNNPGEQLMGGWKDQLNLVEIRGAFLRVSGPPRFPPVSRSCA